MFGAYEFPDNPKVVGENVFGATSVEAPETVILKLPTILFGVVAMTFAVPLSKAVTFPRASTNKTLESLTLHATV